MHVGKLKLFSNILDVVLLCEKSNLYKCKRCIITSLCHIQIKSMFDILYRSFVNNYLNKFIEIKIQI